MTNVLALLFGLIVGAIIGQVVIHLMRRRNRVQGRRGIIYYKLWWRDTPEQKRKVGIEFEVLESRGKLHRVKYQKSADVSFNTKYLDTWINEDNDVIDWIDQPNQPTKGET